MSRGLRGPPQKNRYLGVEALRQLPGVSALSPEGTYALFPKLSGTLGSQDAPGAMEDLCKKLLETYRVAVVPGSARWFGPGAESHLRLVFSTSEKIFREGLDRLAVGLKELSHPGSD